MNPSERFVLDTIDDFIELKEYQIAYETLQNVKNTIPNKEYAEYLMKIVDNYVVKK